MGWCLSVAGPTLAQLEVFFSSDYLSREPFSLFHHGVLIGLDCFSMIIHCNGLEAFMRVLSTTA